MNPLTKSLTWLSEKEEEFTKDFSDFQKKLWRAFTFLLFFTAFSASLHYLLWVNWDLFHFQRATASLISYLLNLAGIKASSSGIYISINDIGPIKIVKDCLGWKSMLALTGLILATRGVKWKRKIYGIAAGLIFVQLANILRLFSTFYSVVVFEINFEIVHTFIWRWGLTLLVLLLWIGWLKWSEISEVFRT